MTTMKFRKGGITVLNRDFKKVKHFNRRFSLISAIFSIVNANVRINVSGVIPYDVTSVNAATKNGGITRLGLLL